MLPIVVTSLVLSRTRSLREIVPRKWREKWEQYLQLRIVVMLSLFFQIMLIALGGRRKKIPYYWFRALVWIAYLLADAVATYSVGVIGREPSVKGRNLLWTFWAPFLLMHLGGPDAITAYALEDNELWLRHTLTLVNQTAATLYILFQTWNGSYISWLYVVIFICGLVKYSERVYALWTGSGETFRESTPERHQTIPRTLEEQKLKEAEGHVVVAHKVIELHQVFDGDVGRSWQGEILTARSLIDIFRPAFTDQLLSLDDADTGKSTLNEFEHKSAFNILAIELGFIYDTLFTKATLFQNRWGIASRVVTLSLTIINLGVFTSLHRKEASKYDKTDLLITFVLVVAAVFLELYGFLFQHLFSDKFICWLIKHKHTRILSMINCLRPLSKRQRWSGKVGQFSLLSYSLREKHYCGHLEIYGFQRYFYLSRWNVEDVLKARIYDHINNITPPIYMDLQSLWAAKWKNVQYAKRSEQLKGIQWAMSKDLEFDMCVLIWHIATAICHQDFLRKFDERVTPSVDQEHKEMVENARVSLVLSQYMMYLLVMHPSLLPAVIGRIKFKDMHSTMTTFFEQHKPNGPSEDNNAELEAFLSRRKINIFGWLNKLLCRESKNITNSSPKLTVACDKLLKQVNTQLNLAVSARDKSKYVMFYGCQLAVQLRMEIEDDRVRYMLLHETWIGLLVLAAKQCKASYHLQHLRRGGELLTHVWLLLVHFGFTDHFKIPRNVEIAGMTIK